MNYLKATFLTLLFPALAFSQIPNSSFENWTNSTPDDWVINSSPPSILPVVQSTDAHTGNFSLQCQIIDDSGVPFGPFVQPATPSHGFSYTQLDTMLYGFYKAEMFGSNLGLIEVWVYDSLLDPIGSGMTYLPSATSYTEFAIPIIYTPGGVAYEMTIIMQMTDSTGQFNVGSYFLIDDLSFTHTSTVNISKPEKNYFSVSPNPANEQISIQADFANHKNPYYTIYDVMGKKIMSSQLNALSTTNTETIDVTSLNPGNYLILITDGERSSTKKIVISR